MHKSPQRTCARKTKCRITPPGTLSHVGFYAVSSSTTMMEGLLPQSFGEVRCVLVFPFVLTYQGGLHKLFFAHHWIYMSCKYCKLQPLSQEKRT